MAKQRRRCLVSRMLGYMAVGLLLCVGLAFGAADDWWFADLFTHFIPHYALVGLVLLLCLLVAKRYLLSLAMLCVIGLSVYTVLPILHLDEAPPPVEGERITLLQYNVHRHNVHVDETANQLMKQVEHADIIVLFEVTDRWKDAIQRLEWAYPYRISQDVRGDRNIVILSRLLVDELEVRLLEEQDYPTVVMRASTIKHEIPFVVYAIHPPPPVLPDYARRNRSTTRSAVKSLMKEEIDYKILVGDLNATRYASVFKEVSKNSGLRDSNEEIGFVNTWPSYLPQWLGIGIDNSLISDNIRVESKQVGNAGYSDHRPVLTTFSLALPAQEGE